MSDFVRAVLWSGVLVLVLFAINEWRTGKKGSDMRKVLLVHLLMLSVLLLVAPFVGAQSPSPSPVQTAPTPSPSALSVGPSKTSTTAVMVWLEPEPAQTQVCKPPKESTVEGPDGKPIIGKTSQCAAGRKAKDWKPGHDSLMRFTTKYGPAAQAIVVHVED